MLLKRGKLLISTEINRIVFFVAPSCRRKLSNLIKLFHINYDFAKALQSYHFVSYLQTQLSSILCGLIQRFVYCLLRAFALESFPCSLSQINSAQFAGSGFLVSAKSFQQRPFSFARLKSDSLFLQTNWRWWNYSEQTFIYTFFQKWGDVVGCVAFDAIKKG